MYGVHLSLSIRVHLAGSQPLPERELAPGIGYSFRAPWRESVVRLLKRPLRWQSIRPIVTGRISLAVTRTDGNSGQDPGRKNCDSEEKVNEMLATKYSMPAGIKTAKNRLQLQFTERRSTVVHETPQTT
jgi:hypothetical protein